MKEYKTINESDLPGAFKKAEYDFSDGWELWDVVFGPKEGSWFLILEREERE